MLDELASALAKYGARLAALLPRVRPTETSRVRDFFSSIPSPSDMEEWRWTEILLGWRRWRSENLAWLAKPDPDELRRVAEACRTAAEPAESTTLRWITFSRHDRSVREVLLAAADLLDELRNPNPDLPALLDELGPCSRSIDQLIQSLPSSWAPVQFEALITRLAKTSHVAQQPIDIPPGSWTKALDEASCFTGGKPAKAQSWWAEWFSNEGASWFHQLAALGTANRAARDFLEAIRSSTGVGCFPELDRETGTPRWPTGVSIIQPGLQITPNAPPGTLVRVERFASVPDKALYSLGVGLEQTNSLELGLRAWHAVARSDLAGLRTSLATGIEESLRAGTPPGSNQLLSVLDALAAFDGAPDIRERILAAVRLWSATGGWLIMPGDQPVRGTGINVKPIFKRDSPAGKVLRVRTYGLQGPAGLIRSAEIVTSAGPPPNGLTELEAAASQVPGEVGEELRNAFRGLRVAGAEGYLEAAVVDLFVLFWERVRPMWIDIDPALAGTFGDDLVSLLRDTFALYPFSPANYRDYPSDWVTVPPGTRMSTGRVKRVLRPGLTSSGTLRLPACVEAE